MPFKCAGRDLNPHAFRHMALNHACLPIPAPAQQQKYYNRLCVDVKQDMIFFTILIIVHFGKIGGE